MNKTTPLQEPPDFSLVLGGPLYQFFRRTRVSGDALELLHRRILFIPLFAWLPLLLLSLIGGHALGGGIKLPFLRDIEAHARFLVALPVLIVAELIVHLRVRPVVSRFVERNIVVSEDLPKFRAAIHSAERVRNSVPIEAALAILVWTVGQWLWRSQVAIGVATWYAMPQDSYLHLTPAFTRPAILTAASKLETQTSNHESPHQPNSPSKTLKWLSQTLKRPSQLLKWRSQSLRSRST
jgi:hypothetical protein